MQLRIWSAAVSAFRAIGADKPTLVNRCEHGLRLEGCTHFEPVARFASGLHCFIGVHHCWSGVAGRRSDARGACGDGGDGEEGATQRREALLAEVSEHEMHRHLGKQQAAGPEQSARPGQHDVRVEAPQHRQRLQPHVGRRLRHHLQEVAPGGEGAAGGATRQRGASGHTEETVAEHPHQSESSESRCTETTGP